MPKNKTNGDVEQTVVSDLTARLQKLRKQSNERQEAGDELDTDQLDLPFVETLLPQETGSTRPYPTLLARVPLFAPISRRANNDTDWEQGDLVHTSWGRIQRFGPGLDIYDEDTLIALLSIARQRSLRGPREKMPIPAHRLVQDELGPRREGAREQVVVHTGRITAYEVNRFLGRGVGGRDLEACRASIKRLAKTSLVFYEDYLAKEGITHLLSYLGDQDAEGEIIIQFYPAIVALLEGSYSYIDIKVRRKLSDLGKAVHRFLSSQPKTYQIQLIKLKDVIRYDGAMKDFKRSLIGQLDAMKSLRWLRSYEIQGTGRKVPFVLHTVRN